MPLLRRARQLLAEVDKPEARELVRLIDNSVAEKELLVAAKKVAEKLGTDCNFDYWAITSEADGGIWVSAWVWVSQGEEEDEDEVDCNCGTLAPES